MALYSESLPLLLYHSPATVYIVAINTHERLFMWMYAPQTLEITVLTLLL